MLLKKSVNTLKRVLKWALYLPVYCSLGKNADLLLAAPFQITAKPKKILFLDTTALCKFCWIFVFPKYCTFSQIIWWCLFYIYILKICLKQWPFFIQTGNWNNQFQTILELTKTSKFKLRITFLDANSVKSKLRLWQQNISAPVPIKSLDIGFGSI